MTEWVQILQHHGDLVLIEQSELLNFGLKVFCASFAVWTAEFLHEVDFSFLDLHEHLAYYQIQLFKERLVELFCVNFNEVF
jgi:hypothetical protein